MKTIVFQDCEQRRSVYSGYPDQGCPSNDCQRAAAIAYFTTAFADRADAPLYVGTRYDQAHAALQSLFDRSKRALAEIKRRIARELVGLKPKGKRVKRITVCPHCQGSLAASA